MCATNSQTSQQKINTTKHLPKQSTPQSAEVRVLRIVNLNDAPWVYSGTDGLSVYLNLLFRADNGERHHTLENPGCQLLVSTALRDRTYPQFAVVLNRFLIILLDVVGEVVDGNIVVVDILHNLNKYSLIHGHTIVCLPLTLFLNPRSSLGVSESALPITGITLTRGDRRRMSSMSISLRLNRMSVIISNNRFRHLRVASWGDEVKEGVYAVVPEAGVTLDTRLLREDIVILPLEVTDNFLKPVYEPLATERLDGL